jgi:PAS domain S-box-containing protein
MAITPSELLQSAIVREPFLIAPDAALMDAIALLTSCDPHRVSIQTPDAQLHDVHHEERSSCVFVVKDHQLIGMLSEQDIVRLNAQQQPLNTLLVRQAMTNPVVTLRESSLTELLSSPNLLQQHQIRHLPILDDLDRLIGFVTSESLLQTLYLLKVSEADNIARIAIEQEKAVSALREREAGFHQLVENIPGILFRYVLHPDGREEFTFVSSRVRDIFELEPEAVRQDVGLMWSRVHTEDIPLIRDKIALSGQDGQPVYADFRILTPNGGLKWVQAIARNQRLECGDILWDGVFQDISDLKRAELRLQS